jgi:hypothetical protein
MVYATHPSLLLYFQAVYPTTGGWFMPITHLSFYNNSWQFIRQPADGLSHSPISPFK